MYKFIGVKTGIEKVILDQRTEVHALLL